MCGFRGDSDRMKKDFQCFPLQIVDIQDMFTIWRKADPQKCFEKSTDALKWQIKKNPKSKHVILTKEIMWDYLMKYDTPSLEFLLKVFNIQDLKDSASTNSDWRMRDLPFRMMIYAAKDSYYNLYIYKALMEKVKIYFRKFPTMVGKYKN